MSQEVSAEKPWASNSHSKIITSCSNPVLRLLLLSEMWAALLMLCWHQSSYLWEQRSHLSDFHRRWNGSTISSRKHARVWLLRPEPRPRMSVWLYCKNTESLKCSWSLNNSCPPPLPTIPLCNPSSLLSLPCEHQRSGRVATELSPVLHPGEQRSRTSYRTPHFLFLPLPEEYAKESLLLYS